MAGEFTGVGLGIRTPDAMGKLSQLLSIQAQKQALEGQRAEVAGAVQTQNQRAALADYMKNKLPSKVLEDGTIDLDTVSSDPELLAAAGDKAQEILQGMAAIKQYQVGAKAKLWELDETKRQGVAQVAASLLTDPDIAAGPDDPEAKDKTVRGKQKLNDALEQFYESHGNDKSLLPAISAYSHVIKNASPGGLRNVLNTMRASALTPDAQIGAETPQFASTGDVLKNIKPSAGEVPDLKLKLSPGYQDTVDTDQLGNKFRVIRDKGGNVVATVDMRGEAGGPASFGVGERDTFEKQAVTNFENVDKNRTSASGAPQQLDQINKALELSKDVSTGAWAQKRAQIESGIGSLIPGYAGMDDASKLQELDKFTERIATDASKVLGVNAKTDAERESIHKQNANIGYTPQAIQAVLKYAKAQTLAIEAKGNAQETWLKSNKITKQHEFETDFRKAYDPRVFQFEAMEPAEQEKFLQSLSKEDRKTIREKTKALIDMGAIPGG